MKKRRLGIRTILVVLINLSFSIPLHAEVVLNMLTWEGYSPKNQVARFTELMKQKYEEDVTLNITYISSADEYFASIRSNSVDIIAPSHNIIKDERYKLITKGLILPIDLSNIPNYKKILPALQLADYTTVNGKVYSVPLVHGPYGFAYNTELVSPAPSSWADFWDTKHKGKYTISADYSEVNVYITALASGLSPSDIANPKKLDNPEIKRKLSQLIANANGMWVGVDTPEAMEKNEIGAAWGFSFPALAKKGQTWKMAEPKEGTTGWVDGHAISRTLEKRPLHKKIAEEWINFTLSDDFQLEAVVRGIGSAPVNISIRNKLTADEVAQFHLDDPDYFKNSRILWPTLSRSQRNFFKRLWGAALKESKGKG